MPETRNHPETPAPPAGPATSPLFHLLLAADRNPEAVYTAVREIESMAGQNAIAQLGAQIHALDAKLSAQIQTLSARIDAVDKQFRVIRTFLFVLLATQTTIFGVLLNLLSR